MKVIYMKKYLAITKNSFITSIAYRFHFFFTAIGNVFYMILIYFLWHAIYQSSNGTLNGMTFDQVFLYLALASSIFVLFKHWIEWQMSRSIISGAIIMDLIKPYDFQIMILFRSLGYFVFNIVTLTIPTIAILIFVFKSSINININIIFFILSLSIAYLISFVIDFIIGTISFYTESIWGISISKEAVVLFLSGAIIPIKFFPVEMQKILYYLPFSSIYNTPLTILIEKDINIIYYLQSIGVQLCWFIILFIISRAFFNKAIKIVTVNGG